MSRIGTTAVVMRLCGYTTALGQEGLEAVSIELGEPVVIAQAEEAEQPWGVWQFPSILRLDTTVMEVAFSRTIDDSSLDSAKKVRPAGGCRSADNGITWQPVDAVSSPNRAAYRLSNGDVIRLDGPGMQDMPKADLPTPHSRAHGYKGVYMIRDPLRMPQGSTAYHLAHKPAGREEWQRTPALLDDPDGGLVCYDPPGSDHAVVHGWTFEQIAEIPDGSLLAVGYGFRLGPDRVPRPKWESYCLRSNDAGNTWRFHGIIGRNDRDPLAGYTEPQVTVLRDGSLLAVLRTECAKTGPMYRTRSIDGGKTWEPPEKLWPFGVLPQLLTLKNGVTVLSFGRPGVHLLISKDGQGREWENRTSLVVESFEGTGISGEGYGFQKGENPRGRPRQTRTSGYTGLVATGPDRFLVAYDQFDYPNAAGNPRKTILVRSCTVRSE